jgi:hypothetical protein
VGRHFLLLIKEFHNEFDLTIKGRLKLLGHLNFALIKSTGFLEDDQEHIMSSFPSQ